MIASPIKSSLDRNLIQLQEIKNLRLTPTALSCSFSPCYIDDMDNAIIIIKVCHELNKPHCLEWSVMVTTTDTSIWERNPFTSETNNKTPGALQSVFIPQFKERRKQV